jgi:hypothetical protein
VGHLRSRFRDRPRGVAQLAGRRWWLTVVAAALAVAPAGFTGVAGALAGPLNVVAAVCVRCPDAPADPSSS